MSIFRLIQLLVLFVLTLPLAAAPMIIASPAQAKTADSKNLPPGVKIKRIARGKGSSPSSTDTVLINYEMSVPTVDENGTGAETVKGVWQAVPVDQAIKGLGSALVTMQKGGRYRVSLSAEQSFGEHPPVEAMNMGSPVTIMVEMLDFTEGQAAGPVGASAKDVSPTGSELQPDVIKYAVNQPGVIIQPSGLKYKILTDGAGDRPGKTDTVLIGYEGRLLSGKVFDSNARTSFPVSGVVPGFGEALQLMQKGGRYRIWIPPTLGYGERGTGDSIPPNSWLVFDVNMFDFISAEELQRLQAGLSQRE